MASEIEEDEVFDPSEVERRFPIYIRAIKQLRQDGDAEGADEGETLLFKQASELLLAHGRGQALLDPAVALWLHFKLEEALLRDAARALNGSVGNLSGLLEVTATSYAAGYIDRGPGGEARGAKTRRRGEVVKAYRVSERLTHTWTEQRPAFANVLAKAPDRERDAFLRLHLHDLGRQYQIARRKT